MRYESSKKPRKCPSCGGKRIASILYGMPAYSEKLEKDIEDGRIAIGGCGRTLDDPMWKCTNCQIEIYKKRILDFE